MIFMINDCSIDTDAYEVRRGGELIAVEPQVFDLLVMLFENRDRVVTKDEIIDRIWKGRIVSDTALSSCVKAARRAITLSVPHSTGVKVSLARRNSPLR